MAADEEMHLQKQPKQLNKRQKSCEHSGQRCSVTCRPGETLQEVWSSLRSEAETVGGCRAAAAGEELCWGMPADLQVGRWRCGGQLWQIGTRAL